MQDVSVGYETKRNEVRKIPRSELRMLREKGLYYALIWSAREVGRLAHRLEKEAPAGCVKSALTSKYAIGISLMIDLYDAGQLEVRRTGHLLELNHPSDARCGIHLRLKKLTQEMLPNQDIGWREGLRLEAVLNGDPPLEPRREPSIDGRRMLEYLSWFYQARRYFASEPSHSLDAGIALVGLYLAKSDQQVFTYDKELLFCDGLLAMYSAEYLKIALDLLEPDEQTLCREKVLHPPFLKEAHRPRRLRQK